MGARRGSFDTCWLASTCLGSSRVVLADAICIWIYIYICTCICIYIYIYMYIEIYRHCPWVPPTCHPPQRRGLRQKPALSCKLSEYTYNTYGPDDFHDLTSSRVAAVLSYPTGRQPWEIWPVRDNSTKRPRWVLRT